MGKAVDDAFNNLIESLRQSVESGGEWSMSRMFKAIEKTYAEVLAALNKGEWTTEPPTKSGYYHYKDRENPEQRIIELKGNGRWRGVGWSFAIRSESLIHLGGEWWSEPIPLPGKTRDEEIVYCEKQRIEAMQIAHTAPMAVGIDTTELTIAVRTLVNFAWDKVNESKPDEQEDWEKVWVCDTGVCRDRNCRECYGVQMELREIATVPREKDCNKPSESG